MTDEELIAYERRQQYFKDHPGPWTRAKATRRKEEQAEYDKWLKEQDNGK
jgi:hypothetical protein